MPFLITTYDKPDSKDVRDEARARHLEYLTANVDRLIAGGGFVDDAANLVIGGMMLIDVDTRAEAQAFVDADPFSAADLFARVEITRMRLSFFQYHRVAGPSVEK